MTVIPPEEEPTLTSDEVARVFRVTRRTVNQWAKNGKLTSFRTTPAGSHHFYASEVEQYLSGSRPKGNLWACESTTRCPKRAL
jgi:excisionase family DNA binding protein